MSKNKGSIVLILSFVVVLALAGGGFVLYKNKTSQSLNTDTNTDESEPKGGLSNVFNTNSNMSPREIFIKKNTEMFNAKSFDEMLDITMKYSSSTKIAEELEDTKYITTDEKKKAFFSFAQLMLVPTEALTDITEEITGGTATVTAYDTKGQEHKSTYVKENGVWKESDTRILLNPKPRQ